MSGFGNHDVVSREPGKNAPAHTSANVEKVAFAYAARVLQQALDPVLPAAQILERDWATEYDAFRRHLDAARQLDLMGPGGVPERNFLALYLISLMSEPRTYVESGFFKGSSIFAALGNRSLDAVFGFDPYHDNLKVRKFPENVSGNLFTHDFQDHDFGTIECARALVYFDDHINTAKRIIQAADKGFKHLIFDDSCGLTGTTQRVWPSMPSLFFIQHCDDLIESDFLEWSIQTDHKRRFFGLSIGTESKSQKMRVDFDKDLLDLCKQAKARISEIRKIPDLSDFILHPDRFGTIDVTQHFVVLK